MEPIDDNNQIKDEIVLNAMSDQMDEHVSWTENNTEENSLQHEIENENFLQKYVQPPTITPKWFLDGEYNLEPITCCLCSEILGTKRSGCNCVACNKPVPFGVCHFCSECQSKWCDECGQYFDCRPHKNGDTHRCMPLKQSDYCESCLKPGCTRCCARTCANCKKKTCDRCLVGAGCCGIGTKIQYGCGYFMHHRCQACFDKNPEQHVKKFNNAFSSALSQCGWKKFE